MPTPNPKSRDCQDMHLPQDSGIQVSRPSRKIKFAFVDGLSNTYLTKSTRSHVMTNAYREKRKRLGEQPQAPRTLWTFDPVNLDKLVFSETSPQKYTCISGPATYETTAQGDEAASDNPTAENYQISSRILTHASMQPKTILGAGTIDHFSTLPVSRTSVIDKFIATYLGPGYDYGLVKRRPTAFNYRLARFKAALDDECSFYAMLIWLRRWAAMTGDEGTALHCLQFKGKCLHVMSERIGNHGTRETVVDVGTMYAALDLSNGEIRAGNFDASKLHWHGLREMVIAAGGLSAVVDREPLIHAILWNYMALGFDQGVEWDYIPPIIMSSCPSQETEGYVCAEELISFITRLQDPEVREWFKHPVILSALRPGTLLHTAICAGNGHSCDILSSPIEVFQDEFGTDFNDTTSVLAVAKHHAPPHAAELRNMQSPRPAIFVFVLNILLDIRDTTKMHTASLTATLMHLFAAIEQALFNEDFDRHPYDLENALMRFIRGIELDIVSCTASTDSCLFHQDSSSERFPSWPLTFSVMRIMGGLRKLNPATRNMFELKLQNIFIAPRHFSHFYLNQRGVSNHEHVNLDLDCKAAGAANKRDTPPSSFNRLEESNLAELEEQIRLELGLQWYCIPKTISTVFLQ